MNDFKERIDYVLDAMAGRPRPLCDYLRKPGPDFEKLKHGKLQVVLNLILAEDANDRTRMKFSQKLMTWDNAPESDWAKGTEPNTESRRKRIHELLKSDSKLEARIDGLIPFLELKKPLIIAEEHTDWYKPKEGERDYYWSKYKKYLRDIRHWPEISVQNLDNSTRSIVECLANPESEGAYNSRGLVMGYVQSGKTANFLGVCARAADAGYRLIIVMAGTWNILRDQTQRRFDKELLGKELLKNDELYTDNQPEDWDDFLEHGVDPEITGHFGWERLTLPNYDFRALQAAIGSMESPKSHKDLPLYHSKNLSNIRVKLLVIKKHSQVLKKLAKDLKRLRTNLKELPVLIVDDESDQAGINTINPAKQRPGKERNPTNQQIVDLLKLLPRHQYIGYTATPYANVLVNPKDEEDIFPKDFVIALDRPKGYMGISDFFDPDIEFDDLNPGDYTQPELAFIRRVNKATMHDAEELKDALRSFVISGALKLYRHDKDPQRYGKATVNHHTMLVHTDHRKEIHATLEDRVSDLWDQCAFNSPKGLKALEALWCSDFEPVSKAQKEKELLPISFRSLKKYLSQAIFKITHGKHSLVLNSASKDAPDFSQQSVWKIIIGGNKLSRGYTVEGLTVSYYRRAAGAGDTLMQMGRWFGFRHGFRDLVRVFLGVSEGRRGNIDLVSEFKAECRREERFREELKRYVRTNGKKPITPKEIPPLIELAGNLLPTAANKMYHSRIKSKNFGGQRSMPTETPTKKQSLQNNIDVFFELSKNVKEPRVNELGGQTNQNNTVSEEAITFTVGNETVMNFLRNYRWIEDKYKQSERPQDISLILEFLKDQKHGIKNWEIIVMQLKKKSSVGPPLEPWPKQRKLNVMQRNRRGRLFGVFGGSKGRMIANYIVGMKESVFLDKPNLDTQALYSKGKAVMLCYPVRGDKKDIATIGFELFFPENKIKSSITIGVD